MKTTLAYDQNAKQFRTDCGKPSKRFYLGSDSATAQQRKQALAEFWQRIQAEGWTPRNVDTAKSIAKGQRVQMRIQPDESEAEYKIKEAAEAQKIGEANVMPVITSDRVQAAIVKMQNAKIAALEAIIRERLGTGAVDGPTITIHAALDAYHKYRLQTELDPDTGKPTEHARVEGNTIALVKRLIEPTTQLSALSYAALHQWCKQIAARPVSLKSGKPIKRSTVRNCLKLVRQFVKWSARHYGYRRPEEWTEATMVMVRRTAEERREALANVEKHYTVEEIGTLWKYAIPVERMLILLGLNFGYAQAEIKNMVADDVAHAETAALRGKSGAVGRWIVWDETRELAKTQFEKVPARRQHIANRWNQLLDRVQKDHPDFRRLSFKWLRKTGSSLIRRLASGEIASLYLSHGESASTDDQLLDVYAAADWKKLNAALGELRNQLLPAMQSTAEGRTVIKLSAIDRIRQMWGEGTKPEAIALATGTSRATVYRYRPALQTVEQ